jgi:hypothetical protein
LDIFLGTHKPSHVLFTIRRLQQDFLVEGAFKRDDNLKKFANHNFFDVASIVYAT